MQGEKCFLWVGVNCRGGMELLNGSEGGNEMSYSPFESYFDSVLSELKDCQVNCENDFDNEVSELKERIKELETEVDGLRAELEKAVSE